MTTETGGPAFPHTVEYKGADCGGVVPHGGMTLRDYFAAQAVQGLLASEVNAPLKVFAIRAYEMADAMLEARTV
jgi:hypothetical protein